MDAEITPVKLDLKKDQKLDIDWQDGKHCTYTLSLLRTMCPCAQCKMVREGTDPHEISPAPKRKPLLTILPGNFTEEIKVVDAQLVGNYALKIVWSDGHESGIYSFRYLRDICP